MLTLYYFEELKLHEIAAVLEVTESRVSQIRQKAIVEAPRRALVAPRRWWPDRYDRVGAGAERR